MLFGADAIYGIVVTCGVILLYELLKKSNQSSVLDMAVGFSYWLSHHRIRDN